MELIRLKKAESPSTERAISYFCSGFGSLEDDRLLVLEADNQNFESCSGQ